jgi:acetyl esterase/lipase
MSVIVRRYGPASLRSRGFNRAAGAAVRRYVVRVSARMAGLTTIDAALQARLARLDRPLPGSLPRGTSTSPVRFDGFGAEWVHGPGVTAAAAGPVLLYLHGGGWICYGLNSHRPLIARLSAAAGAPVLSVGYRMFPQVPLREMTGDCVTAYRWLLGTGVAPGRVVIAGDSAGGHLAFATTLAAHAAGLPVPGAIVALSPMLNLDLASKDRHPNARLDPTRPAVPAGHLVRLLAAGDDPADPAISPVNADLTGLPRTLICVGSTEYLYEDAEVMTTRLAAAGVPATLHVWDRQLHVFPAFAPLLPESAAAVREIGRWIAAGLAQ